MNEPASPITIALRIPGQWSHPRDLIERLPAGCRLTPEDADLAGRNASRIWRHGGR